MGGAVAGPPAEVARRCNFFFLHSSHSPPEPALVPPQAHLRCRTSVVPEASGVTGRGGFGFSSICVRSFISSCHSSVLQRVMHARFWPARFHGRVFARSVVPPRPASFPVPL